MQSAFCSAAEVEALTEHDIAPAIYSIEQLQLLEKANLPSQCDVWIKIDTGMHRVGFALDEVQEMISRLRECGVVWTIRLMSNLANTDDPDDDVSRRQIGCFQACTESLPDERSLANSARIVAWPQSQFDWVRLGIMLCGVTHSRQTGTELGLRPAMTLVAKIIAVRRLQHGDQVGYGAAPTRCQSVSWRVGTGMDIRVAIPRGRRC